MSGGIPIRIRRTLSDTPSTPTIPLVGQPYLNTKDNKFGVYDGTNMLWYPGIDPLGNRMIMNQHQRITGKDSSGNATVEISFDNPNKLEIIHKPSGTVLARFDQTGASFNNLTAAASLPGGTLNRMTHPGFLPQFFSATAQSLSSQGGVWLGPNTYLWRSSGAAGSMSVGYGIKEGAGDTTHEMSDSLSLKATVTADATGQGIRMWLFDPFLGYNNAGKNVNRFFLSIYGPAGKTSKMRIGRDGNYTEITITGTGDWERVSLDVPSHVQSSSYLRSGTDSPFAVDVLKDAQSGDWYVHEPTLQCIDAYTAEVYQYRTLTERIASAMSVWYTPAGFTIYGNQPCFVNLPIPMAYYNDPHVTYDVTTVSATHTPTVSSKTANGFTVTTATTTSDMWSYIPKVALRGSIADL